MSCYINNIINSTSNIDIADYKWDVIDWDNEVEILDEITFNLAKYLKEKGISLDS